ncbi:hypothetical protein CPLU01_15427, partial [Colletotrichum plurivorum]
MAEERRRIEANADVARPLSLIRQVYDLQANNQLGPGGVSDVWTALHRSHWAHAWRLHVSQSQQPAGRPAADNNDQRDFVEFLRRQLAPAELDFALFVVFRDHRNFMRLGAGQEVRRRYQALRGNVGNYSDDDIAFALGTAVVRTTPYLRILNNLLSPRDPAAQRFLPAVVFSAVRDEMLLRHQDPAHPPSVTTADVTNAALRKSTSQLTMLAPPKEEEKKLNPAAPSPSPPSFLASSSSSKPKHRPRPSTTPNQELEPEPEPQPEPQQSEPEPKEDEEQQPRDEEGGYPEFGRQESSSAFTDTPSPRFRARGLTTPIPQFSPLADTPRTPLRAPPAQPPFADSPN